MPVTLPHTVVPLSWRDWDPSTWERRWLYRKRFDGPTRRAGDRVFLDVGGAMTACEITLNGHALPAQLGGYRPFSVELTGYLRDRDNVVVVLLDSRFELDVPPNRPGGKGASSIDFFQPGGIYGGASLRIVPCAHLEDVYARPVDVLDPARRSVLLECTLGAGRLGAGTSWEAAVLSVTLSEGGTTIASTEVPVGSPSAGAVVRARLGGLRSVRLWDVDDPCLYELAVRLEPAGGGGGAGDERRVRVGFREARFEQDGFYLNDRRRKLLGLNRHQLFPFVGLAMPSRVQRKDAEILRGELGCNMVRCSHYPQAPTFLDACDELGLLVWEEVPGWGALGDDAFKELVVRDVAEMVRRDRNHPAIVIWGTHPNEAPYDVELARRTRAVVRRLDGDRPTAGAMASRRGARRYLEDVFAQNDYSWRPGPGGRRRPELRRPRADRPYLVTEAVGTLSGPARHYRRSDPQEVQLGQALAHARVHELAGRDDRCCGVLAWSGFDYPSGNGNQHRQVKSTGVVDLFRIPKLAAALYASQVDPEARPVIEPAFYWDLEGDSPVDRLGEAMICSNLDRLEVYVGEAHLATAVPDRRAYGHLPYPPCFVTFGPIDRSLRPELRIEGYLGERWVLTRRLASDRTTDRLAVVLDDEEIVADGVDATRAVVRALDRYGAPRPCVRGDVTLSLRGTIVLVGDNPLAFGDAGGAMAVWLRSVADAPGGVTLTASHDLLGSASAFLRVRPPSA